MAGKLETIQRRNEYLRVNEKVLSKGLLQNPGFSRHNPYYSNFPQDAVNFSPRRACQYGPMVAAADKQEPSDVEKDSSPVPNLTPSKTKTKTLKRRNTFPFLCPTSVECPDQGCCAIGTYCTVVNGIVGCCDLPVSVLPPRQLLDFQPLILE